MAISLTYTLPLVGFTYPINPLDKEKPTLPQMVGIGHVCYLPLRFPTAHKVIKTLQCRDLLRLVAIKKLLKKEGPTASTHLSPQHFSPYKYSPSVGGYLTNGYTQVICLLTMEITKSQPQPSNESCHIKTDVT